MFYLKLGQRTNQRLQSYSGGKTAVAVTYAGTVFPGDCAVTSRSLGNRYSSTHKCKFKQIYVRTNLKSMCISVTGVKLWNYLDNSLISCKNVHHFKKRYTDSLLNSYVLDSKTILPT